MKFRVIPLLLLVLFPVLPALAAQPSGVVEVVVVDSFGAPVPGAEVAVVSLAGYRDAAVADQAGRAVFGALVGGSYRVDAVAHFGRAVPVDVVVGARSGMVVDLRIVADASPGVLVRPVDPQGLALPGVLVTAAGPGGELREEVAGALGVVELVGLWPGPWRVEASLPGFVGAGVDVEVAHRAPPVVEHPLAMAGFGEAVVVTATRTPVRLLEAPVTTSVIGAERIATSAAGDVAELLRTVLRCHAPDLLLTCRVSGRGLAVRSYPPAVLSLFAEASLSINPPARRMVTVIAPIVAPSTPVPRRPRGTRLDPSGTTPLSRSLPRRPRFPRTVPWQPLPL